MSEQDDRWLERLGLERDPFPDGDTATEFFARGGREKLLDTLADPAGQGRSLVAVVGDAGAGKTTMFHALLRRLPPEARIARVSAGVFLSAKNLLTAIARAMDVDVDPDASRPELRRVLQGRLEALAANGAQAFVLVDDAGELEADALDELVQLAELEPTGAQLRIVLFALPGIRDGLGKASGAQRVAPLLQETLIERYSLNELRGYLQFRLARAGLKGASPFSEEQYAEIFRRSQGMPGRANGVAGRMLRARGARFPRSQLRFAAIGAAAALVLAAILLLVFGGDEQSDAQPVAATADAEPAMGTATEAAAPAEPISPPALSAAELAEAGAWIDELESRAASDGGEAPGGLEAALTSRSAQAPDSAAATGSAAATDSAAATRPVTVTVAAPVRSPAASAQPLAPAAAQPVVSAPVDAEGVATRGAAPPAPVASGAAALAEAAVDGAGRAALLAMDPEHFLLQVVVNSTPARAQGFISEQPDAASFRFYERLRDGVAQYVVVYGDFAAQGDANRAVARVADSTGLSPWVRSVADVQGELQAP